MKELLAFSELAKGFDSHQLAQALDIAVAKGAGIMGCPRCCIILAAKKNGLVLTAGHPHGGHAVGSEIIGEHAVFMRKVMHDYRRVILIKDPAHDPRTPHLRDHALRNKIASIIFAPLLSTEGPIGIMIFDLAESHTKRSRDIAALVAGFVAQKIDVIRKKEEEALIRAEREKQILMYPERLQTAHTLQNPLAIIGGLAARLKNDPSLSDDGKKRIILIEEEVKRLERITERTIEHAKFSPENYKIGSHSVNKFLLHWLEKMRYAHQKTHLHFFKFTRDVAVHFDGDKIETCLGDIVRNAVEAGAKNVWMRTKVKSRKKRVLISIVNDGPPIDASDITSIFDLFFTTKTTGTGQGLAVAKEIVMGHGGSITAESIVKKKNGKKGNPHRTIFKIRLPL